MARLLISNLPHLTDENELKLWLESEGFSVAFVELAIDFQTGTSRGFAFAELSDVDAMDAVNALNGRHMEGLDLEVSEARPDTDTKDGRQIGGTRSTKKIA
jgi:cold-inducible RNA-binding protein